MRRVFQLRRIFRCFGRAHLARHTGGHARVGEKKSDEQADGRSRVVAYEMVIQHGIHGVSTPLAMTMKQDAREHDA